MAGLRAGFVGLGWWGQELAAAGQRCGGALSVAGCYSPDPIEARGFAARHGARRADSLDDLLGDPDIDAVVLATPHSTHAGQIAAAARVRKHVFVEKPMTLTATDARRAIAACREAGVVLAVGHNRRLLAQLVLLRGLLDQGAAGRPVLVEANYSTPEALRLPPDHWRRDPKECPGGAMTALGIHVIDWMHVLFGRVARVQAHFARRAAGLEDAATATLLFESGLPATLTCLYAAPYTNRFVVHGSQARIAAEAAAAESETLRPSLTVTPVDGKPERHDVPWIDTLALQLRRWAEACNGKGAPAVTGQEAARNAAVLDAIVRSAASDGAPITPDYAELWD